MKISLIIPFCNTPQSMIGELIEQLSTLNKENFEVIFVNDGSDDKTNNFVEPKIKQFIYEKLDKNYGVSHARNVGIQQASGDYIFFIDSDDLINLDLLNMLPDIQHDDLSIFISDIFWKSATDDLSLLTEKKTTKKLDYIYAFDKTKGIAMRSACGKLFKKDIILKNNLCFDESLPFYEDALFVSLYYQYVNNFHIFENVIYHYRMNEKSYSKRYNKEYLSKFLLFFNKYKDNFSNNENYMNALYSDVFNSILIDKVVVAFKKGHYFSSLKICKNNCIVESAGYLLLNDKLNSKFKIKLASLIINGHNIHATNKILFHQIIGSLKIRIKKIFKK